MQSSEALATFCTEPDWFEACPITLYSQRHIFCLSGPITIIAVNSKHPCRTVQMHWLACAFLCPMYHKAGFHCAAHVLVKGYGLVHLISRFPIAASLSPAHITCWYSSGLLVGQLSCCFFLSIVLLPLHPMKKSEKGPRL